MAKYTMQDSNPSRKIGSSQPIDCLKRSPYVLASFLRAGDRLDGSRIKEKLVDEDGELVFVLEDGSYVEIEPR